VAPPALLVPPAVLALAGHPVRWQLLDELGRSDRTVGELSALVGRAQNLVSYHLRTLREAGVVTARRSAADGRDAYHSLDLGRVAELLADAGVALHPGLRLQRPDPAALGPWRPGTRVLFLCTGNSARSQIAEALLRARSGGQVEALSAGSHPRALHPDAVRVLREDHGLDIAGHPVTHLDAVASERVDRVVSLCDRVREVCPALPGDPDAVHWSIPDPAAGHDGDGRARYAAFRHVAADIDRRVGFLLASLVQQEVP
jgi:protein-tyrosine-phosphatase/DNA-binding transcriptional ArsR family regulator